MIQLLVDEVFYLINKLFLNWFLEYFCWLFQKLINFLKILKLFQSMCKKNNKNVNNFIKLFHVLLTTAIAFLIHKLNQWKIMFM